MRNKEHLGEKRKKPDLPLILSVSERVLGARNKFVVPIAILISQKSTVLKLREIGDFFSLSMSGVSNACRRARAAIAGNASLANAVEGIEQEVAKTEQEGVKPTFCCKR